MTLATSTGQSTMSFTQYIAQLDITPGRTYAPFWSAFIQVLRNTMEHEARHVRGQTTQSSLRVSTSVTSDQLTVIIESDGPGAEWDSVRNACESLGGSVEVFRAGEATRISFAFPKHEISSERQTRLLRPPGKRRTSAA